MADANEHSYKRTVLQQNDFFEIVSCEWNEKSISPMHDHAWSQCFILVESGRFENTLNLGMGQQVSVLEAGQVIVTPTGARHEIRCLTAAGKTLHVYVPRITEELQGERFTATSLSRLREEVDIKVGPAPQAWSMLAETLHQIERHSINTNSPMFMNQLFSGVMPETIAAEALVTRTKATMATYEASPALTAVEIEVVDALGQLIGWDLNSREGVAVPGGSAANFMALHCARQKKFPLMKTEGLDGKPLKVFVSSEAHYSFKKACAALGIGTNNLVLVPADQQGRMDVTALEVALQKCRTDGATPLLVCATAGTTVLGAFDPIDAIAACCKRYETWLHVDGAWGGPALFSQSARHLLSGIEKADSMTFDGHKLLGAGLTCSFFLTRHAGLLTEANDVSGGDYLFHDDEIHNRGRMSWQCGRRADALSLWALWKSHGTTGLGAFVDRQFHIRNELLRWLEDQPRLKLVAKPEFLNVCIRVLPPDAYPNTANWSQTVRDQLKEKNLAFVNYSTNSDGSFLRLILAHPHLELSHLKQMLEMALAFKS